MSSGLAHISSCLSKFGIFRRLLFIASRQIKVRGLTSEVPLLTMATTSQDWIDKGRSSVVHFHAVTLCSDAEALRYSAASVMQTLVAFQQAGSREAAICHAFLLRENAKAVPDDQVRERANAFGHAGEAFFTCANACQRSERLAKCFVLAKKIERSR